LPPGFALLAATAVALGALLLGIACDGPPQCTDDPSNLTPESTATCETLAAPADPQIFSAGAEQLGDGTLVLTWTSRGLECGVRADNVEIGGNCNWSGWVYTVEIPPELAVVGVIDLAAYPEVRGTMTVMHDGSGGVKETIDDEPLFVGQLELTQIAGGCVSGILQAFVAGEPDPTFGGPALSGGFVAPTC